MELTPEMIAERKEQALAQLEESVKRAVDTQSATQEERNVLIETGMTEIRSEIEALTAQLTLQDVPGAADEARGKYNLATAVSSLVALADGSTAEVARAMSPLEWEISDACNEKRAGDPSTSPGHAGGFIIPPEIHTEMLVEPFMDYLLAAALGANIMPDARTSPFKIPTVTAHLGTSTPVEHQAASTTTIDFGEVSLTQRACQVVLDPSREFLSQGEGASALLSKMIGEAIPRGINKMVFTGTAANGQCNGLKNQQGTQSVDFETGTYQMPASGANPYHTNLAHKLEAMEGKLDDIDAIQNPDTVAWAMHSRAKRAIRNIKSENAAAGTPSLELGRSNVYDSMANEILGYRFRTTGGGLTGGADTDIILGDWRQMVIAYWGGLVLNVSTQSRQNLLQREVTMSAHQMYDMGLTRPDSFVLANNFNTTLLAT